MHATLKIKLQVASYHVYGYPKKIFFHNTHDHDRNIKTWKLLGRRISLIFSCSSLLHPPQEFQEIFQMKHFFECCAVKSVFVGVIQRLFFSHKLQKHSLENPPLSTNTPRLPGREGSLPCCVKTTTRCAKEPSLYQKPAPFFGTSRSSA